MPLRTTAELDRVQSLAVWIEGLRNPPWRREGVVVADGIELGRFATLRVVENERDLACGWSMISCSRCFKRVMLVIQMVRERIP